LRHRDKRERGAKVRDKEFLILTGQGQNDIIQNGLNAENLV
jgi:hypothetical protein